MNICLAAGEYLAAPPWGGVDAYQHYMVDALRQCGHDVYALTRSNEVRSEIIRGGVTIIPLPRTQIHYYLHRAGVRVLDIPRIVKRLEIQLAVGRKVRELEQRYRLDVVEYADSYATGLFHPMLCHSAHVVKLHIPYPMVKEWFKEDNVVFTAWAEKTFVRQADLVVSPSRFLATWAAEKYHLCELPSVVPNPIDTKLFCPSRNSRRATEADKLIVLYVGWLRRHKGTHVLAEAMPAVLHRFSNAWFVLIGGDAFESAGKSVRAIIKRSLSDRGLADRVLFIDFVASREELRNWYRQASICVVPSLYDNLPYVCLEAMACGCPVVASKVGGIPEMVEDGVTGILVPPGDATALSDAICWLLEHTTLREEMGWAARQRVVEEFSLQVVAEQTEMAYRKAMITARA
ncbi:MAG: glycosyltransferase family 4 protein [Chloroflexi bacterium]|nr:glycosyltransferase family 4 protein [Chloroflexota bacterium]